MKATCRETDTDPVPIRSGEIKPPGAIAGRFPEIGDFSEFSGEPEPTGGI